MTAGEPGDPYRWALDLLQSFGSLLAIGSRLTHAAPRPEDRLTGDPVTNLYLTVCGLNQILSDYQHRHFYDFDRAGFPPPMRKALSTASEFERTLRRGWMHTAGRGLVGVEEELTRLSRSLARRVLDHASTPDPIDAIAFGRLARRRYPASLRRSLLKLPQSFRGVDLYPEDCELLAGRAFAAAAGDESQVAVIGLRTSGLYMAPLCAAALDRLGHHHVDLLSLRPGTPTFMHEDRKLRDIAAAGGWAFVVDDPTWRGWALGQIFETLQSLGFPESRLRLAACEIGNQPAFRMGEPGALTAQERAGVWPGFEGAEKVLLEKSRWRVHDHLSNESAERCLNRPEALSRLRASRVTVRRGHPFTETGEAPAVTGLSMRPRQRRFHAKKVFEIEVERNGQVSRELVLGRGVGIGFFGYHSYLVAQALEGATPELLGLEDGVLFTRWEDGPRMRAGDCSSEDLDAVVEYIARRSETLRFEREARPGPQSRAVYSGARQVARTLGRTMGGVGALAQFRVADSLARHLAPARHAVIDARLGPTEWLRSKSGDLVKVDFEEHCFDITDRWVTDPVHDLASASVGFQLDGASEARLIAGYAQATGDRQRLRARFVFHKLMAGLADLEAIKTEGREPVSRPDRDALARCVVTSERFLTRTINGYLAGLYLAGVASRGSGDIWAIDLDDSLETDWLGFQSTSPAGAQALRMLAAHDQLVIASTGRSLAEVQDRCEIYGLAGGIAEYGAVAWDARHGRSLPTISDDSRRSLDALREAILSETDMLADPLYEHTLRLFRETPDGRRGMKVDEISAVIDRHGIEGLEVVEGFRKTVVWAAGCNKAQALKPLLGSLGVDRDSRRLHVIGDEFTDLELMRRGDGRYAPANASDAVRARAPELAIAIGTQNRAAGVRELVGKELHRSSGRCALCRPVELEQADKVLVDILAVQDRSRAGRFAFALHPASLRAFEL